MKKTLAFLLLAFLASSAFAQTKDALQLTVSRSSHGTGDLLGYSFDLSLDHPISRRFDWTNGLTTTIHSGKDDGVVFTFMLPNQPPVVISPNPRNYLHYTTTGVQITSVLNLNILALPRHKLRIGAGPIIRYESSSYPRSWSYTVNADNTSNPDEVRPIYTFDYPSKTDQLNVGFTFGLSYYAAITKKFQLGIKAFFQDDMDGAAITHLGLSVGRFLQWSKLD
ncbi:MAG: hypothetical protein IT258_06890 [Saprospiraceae bacterium]|nr:hypothetical protein [Saprospiraceae bacterium]